ncbi:hypothetical protein OS493_009548 [Desmophyllum pertusum]|uniref:Uncharacterized protein n=1 Tax=Desmophyllum pertusum TaxID=174260 RepID=A0A9X0CLU5_9CNID|nr:hypothetical protein OS493_009548 [Desmophyllum pertusum]
MPKCPPMGGVCWRRIDCGDKFTRGAWLNCMLSSLPFPSFLIIDLLARISLYNLTVPFLCILKQYCIAMQTGLYKITYFQDIVNACQYTCTSTCVYIIVYLHGLEYK